MEKTRFQKSGIYWAVERLMSCKKTAFLVGESLERILVLRERIVMKLHLLMCRDCRNYLANLKFMRMVFQKKEKFDEKEETYDSLDPKARERIKNALKDLS